MHNRSSRGRGLISATLSGLLAASLLLPSSVLAAEEHPWNLHLRAEAHQQAGRGDLAVPIWDGLMRSAADQSDWHTAALYAGYINEYYDSVRQYDSAIIYYELENEYWIKDGKDWGAVDLIRADQIRTSVELYASIDAEAAPVQARLHAPSTGPLAKFEPEFGVYTGIYSEQDRHMGNEFAKSAEVYGRNHAIYLAYSTYGDEFPWRYAEHAKAAGGALQIAWEPLHGLDAVADNAYLRQWAREARAHGLPIFLRFAGEMNGDWTPWSVPPETYIEKFRLVSDVMREEADNVAMVWSPGEVPRYNMASYYPGDRYVDWVGVSLYTEPYVNGNPNDSLEASTPIEKLKEVYELYADRKPIMLSETAVAHRTKQDGKSHLEYGLLNLDRLYRAMPVKYPRLKAITYFNVDLHNTADNFDYSLWNEPSMIELYKTILHSPYLLDKVATGAKPTDGKLYRSVTEPVAGRIDLVPFVRIPDIWIGKLEFTLNGRILAEQTKPPFGLSLNAGDIPDGSALTLRVYNRDGQLSASAEWPLSSQIAIRLDGRALAFEQPPVIRDGFTLAPLRAVFEQMGATVSWDTETATATGRKGNTTVTLSIGSATAYINGRPVALDMPAQLINGYTMAPVRFVGEAFGGTVSWDGDTRTVGITR